MSNNYDVLFAVILRIPDERGSKIYKNIDEITQKLGESIKTSEYENYAVYPLGMELVEPDKKVLAVIPVFLFIGLLKLIELVKSKSLAYFIIGYKEFFIHYNIIRSFFISVIFIIYINLLF